MKLVEKLFQSGAAPLAALAGKWTREWHILGQLVAMGKPDKLPSTERKTLSI
ncbi:hypothetical protein [Achromobacter xylosoxidans]|uniref:hypothetical protein n=1 Tax=Alcaligenes xylosoxydans xylosoxydans TaxID=85698 RepID=UPI0015C68389|nr:hypothetical protein [Achromobacter xylosoxidans]